MGLLNKNYSSLSANWENIPLPAPVRAENTLEAFSFQIKVFQMNFVEFGRSCC